MSHRRCVSFFSVCVCNCINSYRFFSFFFHSLFFALRYFTFFVDVSLSLSLCRSLSLLYEKSRLKLQTKKRWLTDQNGFKVNIWTITLFIRQCIMDNRKKNALRQFFFFFWLVIRAMTTSIFSTDWRRFLSFVLLLYAIAIVPFFEKKNEGSMRRRRKKRKTLLAFFVFFINLKSKHTHTHYEIHYLPSSSSSSSDEKKKKTTRKREKKKGMSWALCGCSFSLSNYVSLSFSSLFTIHIFFSSFFLCLIRSFVCWWSNVCLDR